MSSEKIERTIEQIQACKDMGDGQKDAYTDMLNAVGKAANGSENREKDMAKGMEELGVCTARDAMHRISDIKAVVEEVVDRIVTKLLAAHAKDCPLAVALEKARNQGEEWDRTTERRGGPALVQGHGMKAKADPTTVRVVALCITVCFIVFTLAKAKGWY